ncbi:MAG: hypothetical protein ACYSU0_12855 [Planctomycetota bacterium]
MSRVDTTGGWRRSGGAHFLYGEKQPQMDADGRRYGDGEDLGTSSVEMAGVSRGRAVV